MAYAACGLLLFRIHPELLLLSAVIVVICGILPNIDSGPETESSQQIVNLAAAIAPLLLLSLIPELRTGGIARIALVIVAAFFLTRSLARVAISKMFSKRGLLHSLPAAIIVTEIVYLMFFDLFPKERLFLAGAAFTGFFSHLLLDATMNIDLVGNKAPPIPVLKLAGKNWFQNIAMYGTMLVLGWFVVKDIYPGFKLYGGVAY